MHYSNQLQLMTKEQKNILGLVQKKGPITKSELTLLTKMKLTTLNRAMQPMINYGFIVEADIGNQQEGENLYYTMLIPQVLYNWH